MSDPRSSSTTGVDSIGKAVRRNLSPKRAAGLLARGFSTLRHRGWQALWREGVFRYRLATHGETWKYRAGLPLRKELRAQSKMVFGNMPLVSVVVPLYNTPPEFLRQMIQSMQKQSYQKWELVLVDASDKQHAETGRIAKQFLQRDTRIRYTKLFANSGIAGNTNVGLAESEGDLITLLDHDDILPPHALFETVQALNQTGADMIYSDEVVLDATLSKLQEFHFKPDYGPDTLRGCNYITHLCAFTRRLFMQAGGGEKDDYNGAQDYDLFLRLTEQAARIHHIPKVLYFWRSHAASTASGIGQKEYALQAGTHALQAHLERVDLFGTPSALANHPGAYRVEYNVLTKPLVSVLIPSKDHIDDLERCITSLYAMAGWDEMEVLILENNSTDAATEPYYEELEERYSNLRVLRYSGGFNFAAVCNFGAARAKGSHLLLLNNDTELITPGYVKELLSFSQRPDVGAVGNMLYYPDDTVQHGGLIIGIGGTAGVSHKGHKRGDGGDLFRLATVQNMSAVTGASLMVKKALYEAVGGMDELNFGVAFNDVDLCLKLQAQGLWNIFTPFAQAYHFESKSRGYDTEGPAKERFDKEAAAFREKYAALLQKGDPFYNPHFTLKFENFGYA